LRCASALTSLAAPSPPAVHRAPSRAAPVSSTSTHTAPTRSAAAPAP
jgi:hypothetical protein